MRLLIDANVLVDVLQKRIPHYEHSAQIWNLCANHTVEGMVSSLTFANIAYVMRKRLDADKMTKIVRMMKQIFTFVDFTVNDMETAAYLQWKDYEDAIQAVTAQRVNADYIITRNIKDFENSPIPFITPLDFCKNAYWE